MRPYVPLSLALSALIVLGTGALIWQVRSQTASVGTPVRISSWGHASQPGRTLGWFTEEGDFSRLRIALPDSPSLSPSLTRSVTINFPLPIFNPPPILHLESLTGSEPVQVTQSGRAQLTATAPVVRPDSHPFLVISLPSSQLPVPLHIRLLQAISQAPLLVWFILACALVFLYLLPLLLIQRTPVLPTHDVRALPPEGIGLLETAVLLRGSLGATDISALLFDFGNRGLLTLVEHFKETTLIRRGDPALLTSYERTFYDILLPPEQQTHALSSVIGIMRQDFFSRSVSGVYQEIYDHLAARALFGENLQALHLRYKTLGIVMQLASFGSAVCAYALIGDAVPGLLWACLAGFLIGIIIYRTGYRLTPLSPTGVVAAYQALAFRNYLLHGPLPSFQEHHDLCATYLPQATVLRAAAPWMARFANTPFAAPDWFSSDISATPDSKDFYQAIQRAIAALSTAFITTKDPNVD